MEDAEAKVPFLAAQLSNAVLAAQAFQHDADLLFSGMMPDPEQCRKATKGPPMTLSSRRAEAFGAVCEFVSTHRESANAWRMQATCTHNGQRWNANIRLTVFGTVRVFRRTAANAEVVAARTTSGARSISSAA